MSGASGDRDEKGVCIEPLEAFVGFSPFEQYEYRSAAEREGKTDAKSGPGDLDLTIYSLRKFLGLALGGNPTIIELLFIKNYVRVNAVGSHLQEMAPLIISRQCGRRFLGYMQAQKQRLMGEIGQKKVNRPQLEEQHGYDTKYAMHILRLGFQGVELLSTGKLTIPQIDEPRAFCLATRTGKVPLQDVLTKAGDLERELKGLLDTSPLDEYPNKELIEEWMIGRYWQWWRAQRILYDRLPLDTVQH